MIDQLTLARFGKFTVPAGIKERSHQCGGPDQTEFNYHVTIVASPSCLTPEGFIIDKNDVQRFFENRWATADELPSCERMAMDACEGLAGLIGADAQKIEVTLDGTPAAGLTAFWTREDGAGVGCLYPRAVANAELPDRGEISHEYMVSPGLILGGWPRLPHWIHWPLMFLGMGLMDYVMMHSMKM